MTKQEQLRIKQKLLAARRKRRSVKSGFVRVDSLAKWFNARKLFLSRYKTKKEIVSSLREMHPKVNELLENARVIVIGPDTSPALIVSFEKKGEIPDEAVSQEFVKLAKREGLGHIIGSERYGAILKVPFKSANGRMHSLILMLIDEPRLKASRVPRDKAFEELRSHIYSWAAREPSMRERKIERELRLGPEIPMGPFFKYNAPATDAIIAGIRVLAMKSPKKLKIRSLKEVGDRFEVLLNEWAETEAFKGHNTKQFVASMKERANVAINAVKKSAKYLTPAEILNAIQSSKSLESISSNLAKAIRKKQKALKEIERRELNKVKGRIRARRMRKE